MEESHTLARRVRFRVLGFGCKQVRVVQQGALQAARARGGLRGTAVALQSPGR